MSRLAALLLLLLLCMVAPALAQESTATPPAWPNTPTAIPLPAREMQEALATQNAALGNVGPDLSAPGGTPIVPAENGAILFGYAKWLISENGANELTGPFAPIFIHLGAWLIMTMTLVSVYAIIYAGSYVIRWLVFFFRLIAGHIVGSLVIAGIAIIVGLFIWFTHPFG